MEMIQEIKDVNTKRKINGERYLVKKHMIIVMTNLSVENMLGPHKPDSLKDRGQTK